MSAASLNIRAFRHFMIWPGFSMMAAPKAGKVILESRVTNRTASFHKLSGLSPSRNFLNGSGFCAMPACQMSTLLLTPCGRQYSVATFIPAKAPAAMPTARTTSALVPAWPL